MSLLLLLFSLLNLANIFQRVYQGDSHAPAVFQAQKLLQNSFIFVLNI